MIRRTVLVAGALTVFICWMANALVSRATRNSVPRQVLRTLDAAPPVIDALGVGSSLVGAGFDPVAFEETFQSAGRPVVAINGGLGATGGIEHLLLVRRVLRHHIVRQVIYGFSDQMMADSAPLRNSDLIGNRAMLYYEEPQLTLRYARFGWLDLLSFETDRCCALLRERGTIWTKVEKLRRAMGAFGMPHQASNRFGRVADFDLLEPSSPEAFVESCSEILKVGQMLSPPIQELFEEARARGGRVTVVEMPQPEAHLRNFYALPVWNQFRDATRLAVERLGGSYLDASHWTPEADQFQDRVHLNPSGAARFSRLLAQQLLPVKPASITASR